MANPSYDLRIKQTLTIKPKDFQMKATLRNGLDPTKLNLSLSDASGAQESSIASRDKKPKTTAPTGKLKPMHVFFGSNTGTCETFAHRLAQDAVEHGFEAKVNSLDSALQNIPTKDPVVVITASYEGQSPDNAAHFVEWLDGLKGNSLEGVNYATFGCGHHDWAATYQRIPKLVNDAIKNNGGNRLCELGEANAAEGDMFTSFDTWGDSVFWPAIAAKFGEAKQGKSGSPLEVEVISGVRASTLGLQLQEAYVVENQLLTKPGVPTKRLVRFKLPSDMTYQCGDYLAVLPVNPNVVVRRAIKRFGLPWDANLNIHKASNSAVPPTIPLNTPISAYELFATYVELSQPASKRDLNILAEAAVEDPDVKAELQYIASSPSKFTSEIVHKRVSPLDLLVRYPSIKLSLGNFLAMLPPMRVRQYSISSSPLADPTECTITFSVLNAPALSSSASDEGAEQYIGVASTYLSELQAGERAHVSVRPSHSGFKPPNDLKTPMIMACAGSGIAPFRGFIMDRAEKIRGRRGSISGTSVPNAEQPAKAILYAGCRTDGKDNIHADEFAEWAKIGAVDIRWAFSRPEDGSARQYVQERMKADSEELVELFQQGANIYVCGTTSIGGAVRDVCRGMFIERRQKRIAEKKAAGEELEFGEDISDEAAADAFFDSLKAKERYATDVFT